MVRASKQICKSKQPCRHKRSPVKVTPECARASLSEHAPDKFVNVCITKDLFSEGWTEGGVPRCGALQQSAETTQNCGWAEALFPAQSTHCCMDSSPRFKAVKARFNEQIQAADIITAEKKSLSFAFLGDTLSNDGKYKRMAASLMRQRKSSCHLYSSSPSPPSSYKGLLQVRPAQRDSK